MALDLEGRDALVVGGDAEALRRAEMLLRAGARVVVIAPGHVVPELVQLESAGRVTVERRAPEEADLKGKAIVILSTAEEAHAPRLVLKAKEVGLPICTVDRPELATYSHPAVAEAAGVTIAISTGGSSPLLARRIREDLEEIFSDPRFAALTATLAAERAMTPRGARAARAAERLRGFAVEGRLRFPEDPGATTATDAPPKR